MLHDRTTKFEEGDFLCNKYAFLDTLGGEKTKNFSIKPRIIKTHFHYQFTPMNDETKYIYVGEF